MRTLEQSERELAAASKTIEVLKARVRALQSGESKSTVQKQLEIARRQEERGRAKREMLAVRAQELERHSAALEAEVEARAHAMKTIVDNVAFGFLLIGPDLAIQAGFTRSCHRLFGVEVREGGALGELFGAAARERIAFELGAEQVFDDVLPEELSLDQLPKRIEPTPGRVLAIDPRVVRASDGKVKAILLTVSDATALEIASREARRAGVLVGILRQKQAFTLFLADLKHDLSRARAALERADGVVARRAVHTLKGNAACYGLDEQVRVVHEVEEHDEISPADLDWIEDAFRSFLRDNDEVLALRFDEEGAESFSIDGRQADRLRRAVAKLDAAGTHELGRWSAEVLRRPAGDLLGPIRQFATRLAERLDKRVEVTVKGDEVLVDSERLKPVLHSVVHLVRNAIDHGIEAPDARAPKPVTGHLSVAIAETSAEYVVRVEDDGRGIDSSALVEAAVRRGVLTREATAALSDAARLELLFMDDVSTSDEASATSGRGVGMSAVREAVRRVGGNISLDTRRGRGTVFTLRVPKPDALRSVRPTSLAPLSCRA